MVLQLFICVVLAASSSGIAAVLFMRGMLMSAYIDIFGRGIVASWQKIVSVVLVVSSLSGGTNLHYLERYVFPNVNQKDSMVLTVTSDVIAYESLRAFLRGANSVVHVLLVLLISSVLVALLLKLRNALPSSASNEDNQKG